MDTCILINFSGEKNMNILASLFGNYSKRELKKVEPITKKVLELDGKYSAMADEELKGQTQVLKDRLAKGETLDDILPDAFAVCREAAWRVLEMKHFPVQITGGIVLHQGRISEMKTGEGKTLVATLPAYLNALSGKGVHIVTVNDYLARRDSEWMGKVYKYLGLSVGLIVHGLSNDERRAAYAADITYGTNNEMGFDYLRDNMVVQLQNKVQRGHNFAIVDEVDSILIDEARTPLIISGQGEKSTDLYERADKFARTLRMTKIKEVDTKEDIDEKYDGDYIVDEKAKTATLTPEGVKKAEKYFNVENLSDMENNTLLHHINQAIKAHGIMHLDVDYVVKDGEVIIVDEFTGRLMFGRRYNEGLHQAIEAKEGVKVEHESKTLATITFQNYFRLYTKLSGMTGTALTEQDEFNSIYNLDIIEIPTNKPLARIDEHDWVFKTEQAKFNAVINEIIAAHEKGQPVLVGTISIEKSEMLSKLLSRRGIKHEVLNAKYHEKEAQIIAQAGKFGAVTIATNMAGRGTDIMLGGNAEYLAKSDMRKAGFDEEQIDNATSYYETDDEEILSLRKTFADLLEKHKAEIAPEAEKVRAAGGLYIIGTERHDSRRIDNQLRGRAGRQGDPGSSVFFVSFEDTVMRLFATDKVVKMLDRLGLKEGEPIEAGMVTRSIENAQKRVEENNFGIRKRLLEYDDVMNAQRKVIYSRRHHALMGERIGIDIMNMLYETAGNIVKRYGSQSDYEDLRMDVLTTFGFEPSFTEDEYKKMSTDKQVDAIYRQAITTFNQRTEKMAEAAMPVISDIVENHGGKGLVRVPITDGKRVFGITVDLEESYNEGCKNIAKAWQKSILLMSIDEAWKEHLRELDQLRQSVQNASYEQKDPLVIYKIESFKMFDAMLDNMNAKAVASLTRGQIPVQAQSQPPREQQAPAQAEEATETDNSPRIPAPRYSNTSVSPSMPTAEPVAAPERRDDYRKYTAHKEEYPGQDEQRQAARAPQGPHHTDPIKVGPKVGRNDPCPCGSGKKYKNCHGKGLV